MTVRILLDGYKLFRIVILLKNSDSKKDLFEESKFGYITVISAGIFDEIILILIIISTIKCVGYFNKGMKDMMEKQVEKVSPLYSTEL